MKKTVLVLMMVMLVAMPLLVACQKGGSTADKKVEDVAMNYMTAEDLKENLGSEDYTILDLRKAEDFAKGHIPGSVAADMDAAVQGDLAAGVETMKKAVDGLKNKLVLVCYSGKKYAQAATNALKEVGYDMSNVVTLKDGFKNWEKTFTDLVEK